MDDFLRAVELNAYGLLIDDTGSPGTQANNQHLPPETKTWICVVVPPEAMKTVAEQLPGVIEEIRVLTGARELHFVDIYGARRDWKGVDPQVRLGLFRFMAWIFETYGLKLIVQSFTPEQRQTVIGKLGNPTAAPFDLGKCDDAALLFLLIRAKWYLTDLSAKACVFIDAGNSWKKASTRHRVSIFGDVFHYSEFGFYDSSLMQPIQIADFAAFFHNRVNLIRSKPAPDPFDRQVIEILQPLQRAYVNIPTASWDDLF